VALFREVSCQSLFFLFYLINPTLQFNNASSFNQNISTWNVSGVTSMNYLFADAARFNGDISNWDVANVNELSYAFSGCTEFNGDLSSWYLRSASDVSGMFAGATRFRGKGLSNWDTSSFISSESMFQDAVSFMGDLSSWDVSKVIMMKSMVCSFVDVNGSLIHQDSNWRASISFLSCSLMAPLPSILIYHNGTFLVFWMQALCFLVPCHLTTVFVRGTTFFHPWYPWIEFSLDPDATTHRTRRSMAHSFVHLASSESLFIN
jgi:Mycoplasma protein of unknown function, DUF285